MRILVRHGYQVILYIDLWEMYSNTLVAEGVIYGANIKASCEGLKICELHRRE